MRYVRVATFAKWAGVTRQSIKSAVDRGVLSECIHPENKMINAAHPLARQYLAEKGVDELPEDLDFEQEQTSSQAGVLRKPDDSWNKDELENLTLRQILQRFGSVPGFKQYVDSLRAIAEYQQRDLRVQQARGTLIDRDFVEYKLFAMVDLAFQRLLTDMPDSLGKQIVSRVQSGGDNLAIEVQNMIKERVSQILEDMKRSIKEAGVLSNPN